MRMTRKNVEANKRSGNAGGSATKKKSWMLKI